VTCHANETGAPHRDARRARFSMIRILASLFYPADLERCADALPA
jgi:hypothetical protein